jgi:hypothetical protein
MLSVYLPDVARQRLGKNVPAATNTGGVLYAVRVVSNTQYVVKGQ